MVAAMMIPHSSSNRKQLQLKISTSSPFFTVNIKLSDKAIEALITFSWCYRCDTRPNLEIAKQTV